MTHTGLPESWAWGGVFLMLLVALWAIYQKSLGQSSYRWFSTTNFPVIGAFFRRLHANRKLLVFLRAFVALIFILVISAGLTGNPIPERNLATVLTWTLWWTGLVIAIFFVGSLWCAICPWDTIASWLVKQKLLFRSTKPYSLNYKVPAQLRNLAVASALFVLLTWLELGYGVTVSPYATAVMALGFVALAVTSMLVFERKAFCQYFCPVGRTIGIYSEISMTALRPVDNDVCANCKTLECYHGTEQVESCPTHQVMGRMLQNSLCISCSQCVLSCPHNNVAWAVRSPEAELAKGSRDGISVSIFLLTLLALTLFHGVTMLPDWKNWVDLMAEFFGDSGRLLLSFTLLMLITLMIVLGVFALLSGVIAKILLKQLKSRQGSEGRLFRSLYFKVFSSLGFVTLPITFAYHIAHNLTHLLTESRNISEVLFNPFGSGLLPLSRIEIHHLHTPIISQSVIYLLQMGLIVSAFVIGVRIALKRVNKLCEVTKGESYYSRMVLIPQMIYLLVLAGTSLWLLTQPMTMRIQGI